MRHSATTARSISALRVAQLGLSMLNLLLVTIEGDTATVFRRLGVFYAEGVSAVTGHPAGFLP
jgi:hypothetical protein